MRPDLLVYVTRPFPKGEALLTKGQPGGMARGDREAQTFFLRRNPSKLHALHEFEKLLPGLGVKARGSGWQIRSELTGITNANVIVVNLRAKSERPAADRTVAEIKRLREDPEIKKDVLG